MPLLGASLEKHSVPIFLELKKLFLSKWGKVENNAISSASCFNFQNPYRWMEILFSENLYLQME